MKLFKLGVETINILEGAAYVVITSYSGKNETIHSSYLNAISPKHICSGKKYALGIWDIKRRPKNAVTPSLVALNMLRCVTFSACLRF